MKLLRITSDQEQGGVITLTVMENEYKTDHLFLLVGANPLPVWVAGRLLLRPGGQLYLIHSAETQDISRGLARRFKKDGFMQPVYVYAREASKPGDVYDAVTAHLREIRSGSIGLNYTGGTKLMAVQTYRAVERERPQGMGDPVFSYLDATTLEMRFDNISPHTISVGGLPDVSLSLEEIFALHDDSRALTQIKREPIALPLAEAIAELHRTEAGYISWRQGIMRLQGVSKQELDRLTLDEEVFTVLRPFANILAAGRPLAQSTLRDLCREKVWPFSNPKQLISWFEGQWLESYVYSALQHNQVLNDAAYDLNCHFKAFTVQADVAAMKGYQLYFITCYSGNKTQDSTFKLIEGIVRARQIGGDEAGAAVVCMSDNPKGIEDDVAQTWRKGRVRAFGRRDLPHLGEMFGEWFDR